MDRIYQTRLWVTAALAAFFVGLSYELKSFAPSLSAFPSIFLAAIAFLFGSGLAQFVVKVLIDSKRVRRFLLGSAWIEGYWFVETKKVDGEGNPLKYPGILYLDYKASKGMLKAVTTRFDADDKEYTVVSQVAHARTDDDFIQYLNYFKLTSAGQGERHGLAFGEFVNNSDFTSFPTKMLGKISLEGEDQIKEQTARRISDKKARELYEQYGDNWMKEVLHSNGSLAFS
ncbi:hypothetical protein [Marichromatium gracile]|uniref:SMODS-associating 2TM beta-strand rich effector domain-containing protein n=1 Tax=Marichromatium gracile TaxID=1048 RepID=A0A4R4AGJ0_MARGR|nr:hypothetical protein [Marichromatium gracile]TCW38333.1 hypothetical protein EDC29_102225 [Marichromatium gracile]